MRFADYLSGKGCVFYGLLTLWDDTVNVDDNHMPLFWNLRDIVHFNKDAEMNLFLRN